ncbi:MAG: hypothetical protein OXU23_07495 [Candidatus Poribacteria bacterium]|nr:hypothetical protein [Candidatus Poribacteria bacterium]
MGSYIFGTHQSTDVDAQLAPSDVEHSEIRCQHLTIIDDNGNTLLTLGSDIIGTGGNLSVFGGGNVSIYAKNEIYPRASLDIFEGRGRIFTSDEYGRMLTSLTADEHGGKASIYGKHGSFPADLKPLVSLEANRQGGALIIRDTNGAYRAMLGVNIENGGFLGVNHGDILKKQIFTAGLQTGPQGASMALQAFDYTGAVLGINDRGGFMTIENKDDQDVIAATVSNNGSGVIVTRDKLGSQTGSLPKGMVNELR